jgi:hypothetical protein
VKLFIFNSFNSKKRKRKKKGIKKQARKAVKDKKVEEERGLIINLNFGWLG